MPTPRPTTLDVDYHRHARLPSCVTPVNTLTYYRFGSRAPPDGGPEGTMPGLGRLASPGSVWAVLRRYGNINPLSIDYACRPRLRSRLTLGGLAWPRNPWSFGGQGSHLPYRYSCLHSHSHTLHNELALLLRWMQDAPLPNNPRGPLPRLRRCA